jgi:hypothetical protein
VIESISWSVCFLLTSAVYGRGPRMLDGMAVDAPIPLARWPHAMSHSVTSVIRVAHYTYASNQVTVLDRRSVIG